MVAMVSMFGLLSIFIGLVLPLLAVAFVVYFLIKVIQFMKSKTQHNELMLEKLDALIALQKENHHHSEQHKQ